MCTAEDVSFQLGPILILKENSLFIIMYIHISKIMYLHSGRNKLRYIICSVDFFNHFYVVQKIKPRTLYKLGKALLHWAICSATKCMTFHPLFSFLWKKDTERRDFKAKTAIGWCHCPITLVTGLLDKKTLMAFSTKERLHLWNALGRLSLTEHVLNKQNPGLWGMAPWGIKWRCL